MGKCLICMFDLFVALLRCTKNIFYKWGKMLMIQITSLNETKAQKIENSQEKSKLHCRVFISNATISLFTNACYDLIFSLPSSTILLINCFCMKQVIYAQCFLAGIL